MSLLQGYKKRNAYIATQGPLLNTVGDFWRLMWEFKSKVMVMLCSLSEDGHEACHPFWPYDEGSTAKYGKITVTLQTETSYESFIQRKMLIQDDKVSLSLAAVKPLDMGKLGDTESVCNALVFLV